MRILKKDLVELYGMQLGYTGFDDVMEKCPFMQSERAIRHSLSQHKWTVSLPQPRTQICTLFPPNALRIAGLSLYTKLPDSTPEHIANLGHGCKLNPGPFKWQSDVLTSIPKRQSYSIFMVHYCWTKLY